MKTQNIAKLSLVALTLLSNAPAFAQTSTDWLIGSHRGCLTDSGGNCSSQAVDLLVAPAGSPGTRDGSYVALLIQKNETRVVYYVIDQMEPGTLAMTPREVTEDGYPGVSNAAPSLTLQISGKISNGRPVFTIIDSQSSNNQGFQTPMVFENKKTSKFVWTNAVAGLYGPDKKASISVSTVQDHQASVIFALDNGLSGQYQLREQLPGLFTLKPRAATEVGMQVQEYPRKIVVFVNKDNDLKFVLIDPQNDMSIMTYKRR